MSDYTEDDINYLIDCAKTIKEVPKRDMKEENRHRRNDMVVINSEGDEFDVFIRQSLDFDEDFSVGLVYRSKDGKRITLVRYNGQHEQSDKPFSDNPHFSYHIHRATADNLNTGRFEKHPASITETYGSFDEAIGEFMKAARINDWQKYFPDAVSLSLFQNGVDR
jgi:hypothetical protein